MKNEIIIAKERKMLLVLCGISFCFIFWLTYCLGMDFRGNIHNYLIFYYKRCAIFFPVTTSVFACLILGIEYSEGTMPQRLLLVKKYKVFICKYSLTLIYLVVMLILCTVSRIIVAGKIMGSEWILILLLSAWSALESIIMMMLIEVFHIATVGYVVSLVFLFVDNSVLFPYSVGKAFMDFVEVSLIR